MNKYKDTLPNTMHGLLGLSCKDFRKCLNDKTHKYTFDMKSWYFQYTIKSSGFIKCSVCLAGAVMAQTLKVVSTKPLDTTERLYAEVGNSIGRKLLVIDKMREKNFVKAYKILTNTIDDDYMNEELLWKLRDIEDEAEWDTIEPAKNLESLEKAVLKLKEHNL